MSKPILLTPGSLPPTVPAAPLVGGRDSGPVLEFCRTHDLSQEVDAAVRLADASFGPGHRTDVSVQDDPETGNARLVINVARPAPTGEVLDDYYRCIEQWSAEISPRGLGLICLTYEVV